MVAVHHLDQALGAQKFQPVQQAGALVLDQVVGQRPGQAGGDLEGAANPPRPREQLTTHPEAAHALQTPAGHLLSFKAEQSHPVVPGQAGKDVKSPNLTPCIKGPGEPWC